MTQNDVKCVNSLYNLRKSEVGFHLRVETETAITNLTWRLDHVLYLILNIETGTEFALYQISKMLLLYTHLQQFNK